jgi:pimeloyl-ACP methyl ester carboxylesterase
MTKTNVLCASLLLLAFFSTSSQAAEQTAPDFVAIQSFARLAGVAYEDEAAIKKELAVQHYELDKLIDVPGFLVSGFIASNAATKTQVIVVRGTANEENAFVDLALQLLPDKKTGIKLHQGFSKSANDFYQKALPALHKDYHIITVGHSLGGGVAVILAMYLDVDHFNVEKVITFGQPKVTNVTGARKFADLNIIRVVNPKDVVPLVPPLDAMDLTKLDIYWHMGKEIVLLDNHEYAVLEGVKSMLRISRFTNVVPDESNLQHHMMKEYLRRIADEIPKAKQVPYDTGFNMFGGS